MLQLSELQVRLRKLEAEFGPIRSDKRPSAAPAASSTPSAPARKVGDADDANRPRYVFVNRGQRLMIVSPDGGRVAHLRSPLRQRDPPEASPRSGESGARSS